MVRRAWRIRKVRARRGRRDMADICFGGRILVSQMIVTIKWRRGGRIGALHIDMGGRSMDVRLKCPGGGVGHVM